MVAHVMGKQNNVATDADFCAKRGKDYEAVYQQRNRERKLAKDLDLPEVNDSTVSKKPEKPEDPQNPSESSSFAKAPADTSADMVANIIAEAVREEVKAAMRTETA
jgi:hypothetical protein